MIQFFDKKEPLTVEEIFERTKDEIPKYCNCLISNQTPDKDWNSNEKGQKVLTTHIWQEYLDIVEQFRKTECAKKIYAQRKETIERVFADAKEKHAMRYTHHRGLAPVTRWVKLKYAAMNLKKLANWSWNNSFFTPVFLFFTSKHIKNPVFS